MKIALLMLHRASMILQIMTFPMMQKQPQLELMCESYASYKLTYLVDHQGTSGCHITPINNIYGDVHMCTFKKTLEGPNLITN